MKQNAKRVLSILMALCMVIGFLPSNAFASGKTEDAFEDAAVDVSAEMAANLIAMLTGEDPGEPVQTEDGYTFEMPDSMADAITSAVDEAAGGSLDAAGEPEDIPEDPDVPEDVPEDVDVPEDAGSEDLPEDADPEEGEPDAEEPSDEDGGDVSEEEDAVEAEDHANDLPEDYVDDSNDALYQMLDDMIYAPVSSYYMERGGVSLTGKKIDLFFVIDSTGSMSSYITNVKNNVAAFAKAIGETGAILRLGLIDYRDITVDGKDSTRVHQPSYSPWMDVPGFITELTTVRASGGGDTPETPIDALAELVQPGIGWSSDAYKFAMLITDADYKTDNNHGVSGMEEMIELLREKDIFVSSITPSSIMSYYGELAGLTGGVQIPLSGNFSDDMMDYAEEILKSVSVETETKRDYAIRVTDRVTGLPLTGAKVTWAGGSAVVDAAGAVIITAAAETEDGEAPVKSVKIEMPGYKTVVLDNLFGDLDISLVALDVDEDSEDADKALTLTPSMFKNPKSGTGKFNPVTIEFLGKEFDLMDRQSFGFDMQFIKKTETEFEFPGGKISINHNETEKTFEVIFGHVRSGKGEDDPYWKDDYQKYKSLVQTFNKDKSAKDIYNDFRKLRKSARANGKGKLLFPVEFTAGGFAEVSYASGSLQWVDGGILLGVSTEELTLFEAPLPPAPYIYFRLDFQMDVNGKFGFIKVSSAGKVLFDLTTTIEAGPSLTGTLNLGVPKLASVGGGLTGKMAGEIKLPFASMQESTSLAAKFSLIIKLKLLWFEASKKFGELSFNLYPPAGRASVLSLAEYGSEDFVPMGRPTPVYARAGGDFLYHQNKVFENSAPQLVQLTDGRWLMVWVDAADSRTDENMTALYYSVSDASGGGWSSPRMVDDDGTGDFMPSLTLAAGGTPVVAWQNSRTAWTSQPELEDAAADIEVKAAAFDAASNTFGPASAITSNTSYETSVQVVPEGTGAAAYWLEASAGDPLLASGTAGIVKSVWDGAAWGAPEAVASIDLAGGLNGFTAGTVGGTAYAAYANESGITCISGAGSSGSISTRGDAAGLQIVNGVMYWCDEGGLKAWNGSTTVVESGSLTASEFVLLEEGASRVILMRESTGYANELFASVYSGGSWSEPVAVTGYGMSLTAAGAALDASGKLYWACGRTEISEAGEFGGSDLVVDSCTPAAKVVVDRDAHISSLDAMPGKTVDVSVELANMGLAPASGLSAALSLDGGGAVPSQLYVINEDGSESPLASIGAGETLWVEAKYTLPAPMAGGSLTVDILGPDGASCGTATVEVPAAAADLEVSNVAVVRTGEGAEVTAVVSNLGYAAASGVVVNLAQEGVAAVLDTQSIPVLNTGDSQAVSFAVGAENLSAASAYDYKRFTVEAEPAPGEAITGNNSDSAVLAPVMAGSIAISGEKEIALKGGQKLPLTCETSPAGSVANLIWMSTNTSVATVENGVVSAWGDGTADIIACHTDASGNEISRDKVTVTVTEGVSTGVSSVSITPEALTVQVGRSGTLTAVVAPSTAVDKSVAWYVDDPSIVAIQKHEDNTCVVEGLAEGSATITVRTNDGAYVSTAVVEVVGRSTDTTPGNFFDELLPEIMMRTYRITTPSRVTGGTVSLDSTSAMAGRTVTITAVPDAGYELDSLTVVTSFGRTLPVTDVGGGKYTFVMAEGTAAVNCVFKEIERTPEESEPVFVPAPVQPKIPFVDVPASAYCYDAVQWAVNKGIANGTGNYIFSPAAPCTRADIVTFLWRAAGSPAVSGVNTFTDVSDNAYYRDAVLWAVAVGITNGAGGNTFRPNDVCTRGQAMTFLYRYAGSPAVGGASGFADVDSGAYYAAAVGWAVANQITQGVGANQFSPDATCTRSHIVTFLYRALA